MNQNDEDSSHFKIPYDGHHLRAIRQRDDTSRLQRLAQAICKDIGADQPDTREVFYATAAGSEWRMRGIPIVGVHGGLGGAIPGTRP